MKKLFQTIFVSALSILLFTMPTFAISVAPVSGASVTDAGQYSGYTCVKVTGSGLPVNDTSLPTTDTSQWWCSISYIYKNIL